MYPHPKRCKKSDSPRAWGRKKKVKKGDEVVEKTPDQILDAQAAGHAKSNLRTIRNTIAPDGLMIADGMTNNLPGGSDGYLLPDGEAAVSGRAAYRALRGFWIAEGGHKPVSGEAFWKLVSRIPSKFYKLEADTKLAFYAPERKTKIQGLLVSELWKIMDAYQMWREATRDGDAKKSMTKTQLVIGKNCFLTLREFSRIGIEAVIHRALGSSVPEGVYSSSNLFSHTHLAYYPSRVLWKKSVRDMICQAMEYKLLPPTFYQAFYERAITLQGYRDLADWNMSVLGVPHFQRVSPEVFGLLQNLVREIARHAKWCGSRARFIGALEDLFDDHDIVLDKKERLHVVRRS